MSMSDSSWKDGEVALGYLKERCRAVPHGEDQVEMLLDLIGHFLPEPGRIIDLGCGDGFLERVLLPAYPRARAVLIDHSEPMLERARVEMAPFAGRCEILQGDLSSPLPSQVGTTPFDLAVSRLAIHHLPHERKRSLYREIFDLLSPGGLFVNIDHVSPGSASLESLFESIVVDHIARFTGKDRAEVDAAYRVRPDKADNILASVETQAAWLREIGFEHADCHFKWLELAVFGGVKPG
jgi:tRNA (cmo5U34)-methyltransferase